MAEAIAQPVCPLTPDVLPANFQKHVDPKAPLPLRMMGAKALVPMGPKEMVTALFMLTFDAEAGVRETAAKSSSGLPDRILSVALRDETIDPPVLDYYAELFAAKDEYVEMLVLNSSTPDTAIQKITVGATERILEIVAQNQLRMLRHSDIVRALANNPATRPSTVDNVCDFCVRSGLLLEDLPAFRAARRRIHGGAAGDDELARQVAAKQEMEQAEAEAALEQMGAVAGGAETDEDEKPLAPGEEKEQE